MKKWIVAALLAGGALPCIPSAMAQTAPDSAGNPDDIIVTARRREENLQTVPAAITAFNAEAMLERAIRSDSDLQTVTPGLTIRQTQGNNSLTYAIRGQTADTFSGTPSAVIAYLNEVPLTIASASSFYDLDSVQVLKGPQGTLFGRNATGGAVLFSSAKPSDRLVGLLRGRVGNMGAYEAEGMINLPLAEDKVLFRAAFDIVRRDGYILNTYNNEKLGKIERNSGRASLTLKPVDGLVNTTIFQYNDVDGTNTGASYPWSIYSSNCQPTGLLNCATSFLTPYLALAKTAGIYKTNHPGGARHHGYDWVVSNTTSFDLGENLTLKNIFGTSRAKINSVQPQLGIPFVTIATYNAATGQVGNQLDVKSYSDELQLQGEALDGKLNFIVGAYFQWQKTDTIWPQSYFLATPFPPLQPNCATCVTNAFRIQDDTKALYGQATYEVADGLKLTAGLRYTWEDFKFSQIAVPGNYAAGAPNEATKFSDPSWEVGLEYQASPEVFTYLKTRGSFRSGGFNGAAPPVFGPATAGGNVFKSEHTQDIEAGIKFRGDLFGRPATFTVDAFNQWVKDVQRVEFPPGGAVTVNVPSQIVQGIEGDFTVRPADWLDFGAQGAYVNARYTNGNVVLNTVPYLYGPVADTPKFSGTVWAKVTFPSPAEIGAISLRGDLYGQTSQYFSNASASRVPDVRLPGYALVNMRLGWDAIMGSGISAAAYVRNLGNRGYFVGGMPLGSALGHNSAAVGEPRTYGLELSVKF